MQGAKGGNNGQSAAKYLVITQSKLIVKNESRMVVLVKEKFDEVLTR